jgi:hypothetical protein
MGRRAGWVLVAAGAVAVAAVPVAGVVGRHPTRALVNLPLILIYSLIGAIAFLQQPALRAARRLLAFGVALPAAFAIGYCYSAVVARSASRHGPVPWPSCSAPRVG